MNRRDEESLIAQIEADLDDPDAWEDDPAPVAVVGFSYGGIATAQDTTRNFFWSAP